MKRAELRLHLLMCKYCARYAAHLQMMSDGFKKLFEKLTRVEKGDLAQIESEVLAKLKKNRSELPPQ